MLQAKFGDTVNVQYTGTLDNGKVFDATSWRGNQPLTLTLGEGKALPAFEQAIMGMRVNEWRVVRIPPADAYGAYNAGMAATIRRSEYPTSYLPRVGDEFDMPLTDGRTIIGKVTEVYGDSIKIDANHPLAGKNLNFEIKLVEIV
jgi:peptidylprolyl isomerase